MSKVLTLAGAVSALAFSIAAVHAAGGIQINKPTATQFNQKLDLKIVACTVAGTPSEFPDDIWIMNKGVGALAAGTKVQWSVPSAGKQGNYTLAAALNPGQGVKLNGVLGNGVEAGKACNAKFV